MKHKHEKIRPFLSELKVIPAKFAEGDSLMSEFEIAPPGFGEGIALQLAEKQRMLGLNVSLTAAEKEEIITEAAIKFGEFLTALGVDWKKDPNSFETPRRVASAYVLDLWKGRYEKMPKITSFPNERGYTGLVCEDGIPLTSMCTHHHQLISGMVHVAYIPLENGKVIGLSKLNRIVEHFGRRPVIQEALTMMIHNAIDKVCRPNAGVAVIVVASHHCVKSRGVKHSDASMQTNKFSGAFEDKDSDAKEDFFRMTNLRPR